MKPIRVLIVDDHEIVREGLCMLLSEEPDILVVGQADNGTRALDLAATVQAEVILMDLVMPEMDGIEATRRLGQVSPSSHILVLTTFASDEHVRSAIQAGAMGYLLKDVKKPELLHAIRTAAQGKPVLDTEAQRVLIRQTIKSTQQPPHASLTVRELSVLTCLAHGQSNKEIAAALHLTEGTVKVYVSTILEKLGVADRTQAALYAVKHRLGEAPGTPSPNA
jgi:DNA-binding NarL/FixJ family response regulator